MKSQFTARHRAILAKFVGLNWCEDLTEAIGAALAEIDGQAMPPKLSPTGAEIVEALTEFHDSLAAEKVRFRESIVESLEALREAGGNAWDGVGDVDEYLGRTGGEAVQ